MTVLFLDWETRSKADLPEVGLDNYARDPSTDIWFASYAFGDEPVGTWSPGESCPSRIKNHIESGGEVAAFNAPFEIEINNEIAAERYGWPRLRPDQCVCIMAMAYAMGLPGKLERAAPAAGIKQRKDAAGHRLMLQMCRPREVKPDGSAVWWDEPDKVARLVVYGNQDIEVERELYKRLVPLSEKERQVWLLDYKINRRGIQVDLPAVKAAAAMVLKEQDRLNQAIRKATDNVVGFVTEVARLTKWVRSQGVEIDGLAKADVLDALKLDTLPANVREALLIRQEAGRSSTAKLNAIVTTAGPDGCVRGTKQYHGAGTGRWAGRTIQPDNFPRPTLTPEEVEAAIKLIRAGDYEKLNLLYGAPMSVAADCLRGMIVAPEGCDLLAGDFANVEGRVLPWLAGEEWKLQAFRDQDAKTGPEIYLIAAAKIYHTTPSAYTKKSPERQTGKTAELACGYQGGVGAFRTMEKSLHLDLGLTDDEVNNVKNEWRAAHPAIVWYWRACEEAAINAVLNPGVIFAAGAPSRLVRYKKVGSFLLCGLPSNRAIWYPYPKILPVETPWGDTKDALTYMKVLDKTKANKDKIIPDDAAQGDWQRVSTYGGKLVENNTQAVARDLLAEALLRLDAAGYDIPMHVHDEAVAEVWDIAEHAEIEFPKIMAAAPSWAAGLPIAVETWRAKRYRK